jgi:hypothetical protein
MVRAVARRSLLDQVVVRVLDHDMRVYRISKGEPAELDDFRSHYELALPPRGIEDRATVIHMAVSMFETAERCWELIERTNGRSVTGLPRWRSWQIAECAWQRLAVPRIGPSGHAPQNCNRRLLITRLARRRRYPE